MQASMYQVDAFTDSLFAGNPAAVFVLDEFLPDALMQALAAENNLAETAFVVPREDHYDLRWFTPTHEAAFCGHATLASAHTLMGELDHTGPLVFQTVQVGQLIVTSLADGMYTLDIPRLEPQEDTTDLIAAQVLKTTPQRVFRNFENLFAVLGNEQDVRRFRPPFARIAELEAGGLVITAQADVDSPYDFVSRYFAPQGGIPEDPVTGSTHATLVPYWSNVLDSDQLTAFQCSARGGTLHCRLSDERVYLSGAAVTYLKGTVNIPSLFDV